MTEIEKWVEAKKQCIMSGEDIENELTATWPYFIVDTKRPAYKKGPGHLPATVIAKIAKDLQSAIYKVRKASTNKNLYSAIMPLKTDHYKFFVATSTQEELDILVKGFENNDQFEIVS